MNATWYKDLSDASSIVPICEGVPLNKSFSDIDTSNKIVIVNGEEKPLDYIPKEGDVIIVRSTPGAITTVALIVSAVVGAVAVGVAIYAGVQAYKAREQAEQLTEKLKNLSDDVTNIPYLKGASNAIATGKTQPYIIGSHLFTPYKLISGYNVISGETGSDQYYHVVLQGGFNKQVLRSIFCDDVKIKTWDSGLTTPQEGSTTFDTDSVFYDASSLIEIAQDGNAFATAAFNKKIVTNSPGDELKKSDDEDYENLVYTLEENTRSADVCIMFKGLRGYDDSGNKIARTVVVVPEYSLNSGATWTGFTFNQNGTASNSFSYNVNKQLRFNAHVDFTYAQVKDLTSPVMIRVRCTTPAYDGTANDGCYVQWIQSYIYNPTSSAASNAFVDEKPLEATEAAVSTMIGIKIKATLSNQYKLDKINVRTSGVARIWSGTEWSTTKIPTSNPAAWLLEVLTSPTHTASQCDDSEIDLDSFGELYEFCETNEFHCNTVLSDGDTKENVLAMILDTCQSVLYKDIYGKISIATDKVKENAIAILNTQNCVSFSNKKDMSRVTDGIKINYTNAGADYESDTYLVMRDGVTRNSESILREMTVTGIEEYNHIVKYGRRLLAIDQLRPKTATATVGNEGVYYTPLGKILVQHPSLKIGLGSAEIKSVIVSGSNIVGLELYEPIQYDSSVSDGFGIVIQAVDEDYCTPISSAYTAIENGYVTEIALSTPIALSASAIPHAGDIVSYGYLNSGAFDTITSPMLITGIEPVDQGFTLTLVDYNEAVYNPGTIPDYAPNLTTRKTPISVPSEIPAASKDDLSDAVEIINTGFSEAVPDDVTAVTAVALENTIKVSATWTGTGLLNAVTGFVFSYSKNGGTNWTEVVVNTNVWEYTFNRSTDLYPEKTDLAVWRFRVKAVNTYGNRSLSWGGTSSGVTVDTSKYLTWIPPAPVVTVVAQEAGLACSWTIDQSAYYGSNKTFKMSLGGVNKASGIITPSYFYTFNRDTDGYPEKDANGGTLDFLQIKITAVTAEKQTGTESAIATPNVSSYLTWIPSVPVLSASAAGRKITLSMKQANSVYGFSTFRVRIRRSDEASWYELGSSADAYSSETAYKTGSAGGYTATPLATYDIAVPLKNQSLNLPEDTSYYFELSAVTAVPTTALPLATNVSAYGADILAVAKATGTYDVVSKAIKTAQLDDDAVTLDKLNVLATNLINQLTENGNTAGWTSSTGQVKYQGTDSAVGYVVGVMSAVLDRWYSDEFSVTPNDVLKLSFSVRSPTGTTAELCVGYLVADALYEYSEWNATTKAWGAWSGSVSNIILHGATASISSSYLSMNTFIVGSNVSTSDLPAPSSGLGSVIYAVRAKQGSARVSVVNRSGAGQLFIFAPSARSVVGGTITASNIIVEKLTSITNKLGTVLGDDEINYKMVFSPGATETDPEGTLLLGATTDESYLRRYKSGGVWYLDIKTSRFVVDSISSKIYGDFETFAVGGTTAVLRAYPASYVGVYGVPVLLYAGAGGNFNQGMRIANSGDGYSVMCLGAAWATSGWQAGQWCIIKKPDGTLGIGGPNAGNTASAYHLNIAMGGAASFSNSVTAAGNITAGTGYSFFTNGKASSTDGVSGVALSNDGRVEICSATPQIDFHFANSTADYTSRIQEVASGVLAVTAGIRANSYLMTHGRTGTTDGVNGNILGTGYIDICGATPYIAFHYGNSTATYTSRIIESASGVLSVSGAFVSGSYVGSNGKTGAADGVSGCYLASGGLDVSGSTPFIDFHYGNSTADYTSRIYESAPGQLTVLSRLNIETQYWKLYASQTTGYGLVVEDSGGTICMRVSTSGIYSELGITAQLYIVAGTYIESTDHMAANGYVRKNTGIINIAAAINFSSLLTQFVGTGRATQKHFLANLALRYTVGATEYQFDIIGTSLSADSLTLTLYAINRTGEPENATILITSTTITVNGSGVTPATYSCYVVGSLF